MTGQWEGNGWKIRQDRTIHNFHQTEEIQFKLDSTIMVIDGHGISDGEIIHKAFALINYNKIEDNNNF